MHYGQHPEGAYEQVIPLVLCNSSEQQESEKQAGDRPFKQVFIEGV
jgi:hypothetical protein